MESRIETCRDYQFNSTRKEGAMKTNETAACPRCAAGDKPIKMKRQHVHYVREQGRIVVCDEAGLKPRS